MNTLHVNIVVLDVDVMLGTKVCNHAKHISKSLSIFFSKVISSFAVWWYTSASYMQDIHYGNMQHKYINMRLIFDNMQQNFVNMRYNYVNMQLNLFCIFICQHNNYVA